LFDPGLDHYMISTRCLYFIQNIWQRPIIVSHTIIAPIQRPKPDVLLPSERAGWASFTWTFSSERRQEAMLTETISQCCSSVPTERH
jgi:hypothetical protein